MHTNMTHTDLALRCLIGITAGIGIFTNLFLLVTISKISFNSRLTTILMICQSIYDGTFCVLLFLYKAFGSEVRSNSELVNKIFCFLWYHENIMWLAVIASVQNMVCISVDRFMAVMYPLVYRTRRCLIGCACFTYLIIMSLFLYAPNVLSRRFQDGRCHIGIIVDNYALKKYIEFLIYMWFVNYYLAPFTVFVILHIFIIRKVNRPPQMTSTNESPSAISAIENADPATGQTTTQAMNTMIRQLTKTIVLVAVVNWVLRFYDALHYLLGATGLLVYDILSVPQQIGVFLTVLSSVLSPCIFAYNIPRIRAKLIRLSRRCCPSVCWRVKTDDCNAEEEEEKDGQTEH